MDVNSSDTDTVPIQSHPRFAGFAGFSGVPERLEWPHTLGFADNRHAKI
jgi:hypothetical protein